ncbi:MAG: lipoprotein [[Eubacterium] siraeum]
MRKKITAVLTALVMLTGCTANASGFVGKRLIFIRLFVGSIG